MFSAGNDIRIKKYTLSHKDSWGGLKQPQNLSFLRKSINQAKQNLFARSKNAGTKIFIAVVGLTMLCAWTTKPSNDLKKAEWLIGTWENKTPKGSIYETWSQTNDHELSGKSYFVKEKDTIVFETIRIVQEPDGLFYIPTVKNQNDGLPVRFAAKTISETQLVFENAQHDFPQVISYTKNNAGALTAEISGTKNGQERKQVFSMQRIK